MSNSVQPHRQQPTRLPRPWDSPGKNTGVGCHFLLQCMKVKMKGMSLSSVRLFVTPWTAAYQAPPSVGFSRQEYCSGVAFPSPVHENEKRKGSHSVLSDSSQPHGLQPTRLLHLWDFPGKSTDSVYIQCYSLHSSYPLLPSLFFASALLFLPCK